MKVLAIVQARMGSTRLPGKVLMKIMGKPILAHMVDFLRFSKFVDKIIIATTNLQEDDKIVDLAKKLKVSYFRGSANDVLERYYECSKYFKGDLIIRMTADDPIVIPTIVDEIITVCKKTKCDYATNMLHHRTYPLGINVESFTFSTLKRLYQTQNDPLSREHVTHDIIQNSHLYQIKEISAPKGLMRPNWRLTVDYIEDFYLVSEIFSRLYSPDKFISYGSLVGLLDKNKSLLKINEKYC